MDVTMEDVPTRGVEFFSGCSSTTTSLSSPRMYAWNALSPVVADDAGAQDLHGLTESMLCDGDTLLSPAMSSFPADDVDVYCCSNGSAPSSSTTTNDGDCHDKDLRLLHLLMAAAEALSGQHKSPPELARVILLHLKQMQMVSHVNGDDDNDATVSNSNMERLATHFTDALLALLDGSHMSPATRSRHFTGDVLTAFAMLQHMSPYIKFGHFTANQAILEAAAGGRRVHVVDYDIADGVQWASLMQAMTTTTSPPPLLRITAVVSRGGGGGAKAVQEAGRRLAAFAASIGQPFSFGQCRLDADEQGFRPATLRMLKGERETLVANCVLNHAAAAAATTTAGGSVASFLAGMATLGAKLLTVVEEDRGDDDDDEEAGGGGFVARFMAELRRYSAVWDSLEAGFPAANIAGVHRLVERAILAPNIAGAVSRAYHGAVGGGGWGEWMRGKGFTAVPLSRFNHCQAKLLLGLFNDGYTVEETSPNKIVLGWKARRLLSASVWAPPPVPVTTTEGALQLQPVGMSPSPGSSGAGHVDVDYIDSFLVEPLV